MLGTALQNFSGAGKMSTEFTKPALAPKPQGLDSFSPKCSSPLLSKTGLVHQAKSMSRGPKPPIAPKPILSPATERRCIEDENNSLNKCSNGDVVCPVEIYDEDHYRPVCDDMTFEDYISVPESQLTDEECTDFDCEKSSSSEGPVDLWNATSGEGDITSCSPSQAGEEDSGLPDSAPSKEVESGDFTELDDSDNTDALSLRSSSTAEADSLVPHSGSMQFKNDLGDIDDFLLLDSNECNGEPREEHGDEDLSNIGNDEVILTQDASADNLSDGNLNDENDYEGSLEETPGNNRADDDDGSNVTSDHEHLDIGSTENSILSETAHGENETSQSVDETAQYEDETTQCVEETAHCENETTQYLDEIQCDNESTQCVDEIVQCDNETTQCVDERVQRDDETTQSEDTTAQFVNEEVQCEENIEPEEDLATDVLVNEVETIEDNNVQKFNDEELQDFNEDLDSAVSAPSIEKEIQQESDVDTKVNNIFEAVEEPSYVDTEFGQDNKETKEVSADDNPDDSCQIIPFECESNDDVKEPPEETQDTGNVQEETTWARMEQIKEEDSSEVIDTAADDEGSNEYDADPAVNTQGDVLFPKDEADTAEQSPEDQETKVKEFAEIIAEAEEDDSNPYVLEDSPQSRSRKLLITEETTSPNKKEEGTIMEEFSQDDGGHLFNIDRKNIVTRTRSYSGKIPGNVPETVPEETVAEMEAQPCHTHLLMNAKSEKSESKPLDFIRALPRKPSRFIIYPRSCSVEGRENAASMYIESDINFSPYIISSSGSFSQRNYHTHSGMSTPTSLVDIPPPFQLASITKKPITKSSPSLFIENDSSEKGFKKKKSSFKRFLTLKFKKKTENKVHVDVNVSSSRSSSESSYHGSSRLIDLDRRSIGNTPQLQSRSGMPCHPDSPTAMLFYKDMKRKGTSKAFNRSVARVESFEDRSRPPFMPLPLTKPRSISFPNADTSDYENIPAMNSYYENIQIPPRRPARASTFTEFFEDPSRALSSANENDGYVDMSSFNTFEVKQHQTSEQEAESAYTEPYKVCPIPMNNIEDMTSDEDQRSSEGEESSSGGNGVHKDGPTRALNIVEELVTSERGYVETLRHLYTEFHTSMLRVLGSEEEDEEEELRLRHGLSQLQYVYLLHEEVLEELEERIKHWEENQKIADVFLSRKSKFQHHTAFIVAFDKTTAALEDCSLKNPQVTAVIRDFERNFQRGQSSVKHKLVKVVQRIFQYHMILTDYLNNLCPDLVEYEDTQAALLIVSEVADRAIESMRHGENLQKLVQIEYSVRGQRSLLQPGREFVKEGTLMKVSGKNRHPRHLFLMNDVLLYTYAQKDGKYRLKNTLSIPGMRVSRPIVENAQHVLKIECMECCLMLSASSCSERDDWFSCISRTVQEYYKAPTVSVYNNVEMRERLGMFLGERPPSVAHMSHVMMCMNCGSDFTLTLRRHHCHACGKIVCRSCSRNKYPLKYLKDRPSKVCNGCYAELRKRELASANTNSSPQLPRSTSSTFTSMLHSFHPSAFKRHKKVPSALMEAAASGESSSISGYLHRCKKGKKYWKKRWFVIKGKVLYTYTACEEKIASESLPLLGFHIVPDNWDQNPKLGTVFQLYHKQTLFYSFKAADTNAAIRWVEAIKAASVL
ncbi:FYVE, RhoGEF and PH domain-containing protein 5 isoform X2 [Bufo gargarizans]|uniref:FYVE, RhoGEF and PH domain-containing protein 5 isoform X2 n=1 Tax=Bufo gargarizans TaxID=30331 RepID=UPI001CF34BDA|nr:FYVE, RhoGEF and PH domain-containing protein 5 isoform X2 [Bufo gargarizans]